MPNIPSPDQVTFKMNPQTANLVLADARLPDDRTLYSLYARLLGAQEMLARGCTTAAEIARLERLFCSALRAADMVLNMPTSPPAADAAVAPSLN